ncbi:ABC transporter permease subunit, partial [Chloroflexota bacterium]
HWATLGRITRAAMLDELGQQYITAARGRGLSRRGVVWRHAFRNAILPGLSSSAVSVASIITGVFIVESIYNFNGLSELLVLSVAQLDLALSLGLAIYSVLFVLPLMFILDIVQAAVDPRLRTEEV